MPHSNTDLFFFLLEKQHLLVWKEGAGVLLSRSTVSHFCANFRDGLVSSHHSCSDFSTGRMAKRSCVAGLPSVKALPWFLPFFMGRFSSFLLSVFLSFLVSLHFAEDGLGGMLMGQRGGKQQRRRLL